MACVQSDDDVIKGQANDVEHHQQHQQHQQQQQQNQLHQSQSPQHQSYEHADPVIIRSLRPAVAGDDNDNSSLSPHNVSCNARWSGNIPPLGLHAKPLGWMDGLLGCMRPVMSLLVKSSSADVRDKAEEWEIPFESITNLEWLGSGAQGTVFSGYLRNEIVAVKKVRDYKETDIIHLRRLDHENIIKFK